MVDGRNHAAAATDGEKLWVFGGRGPGSGDTNMVANGFADVQVYDPGTDTWESSNDVGSTLTPLPIGRGGTGKAVWYQGEFYVMGGETLNGPGATVDKVYDRVDVYDPADDSWRLEAPLPTARHGIFPMLYNSRMFVAGGGIKSGNSKSTVMEVFTRQ
jgi:N-acetylneuraminic acid mutarotase